jgi:ElaB/YqjD/DUF883 family membrane-anchored ribosome-binding protein
MESTANANDLESSVRHLGKASRAAARDAARQARATVNQDVQRLISDVEDLVRRVADVADPEINRLRAKVENTVASTKQAISEGADQLHRQGRDLLEAGDRYVQDRTWESIGVAAVAALAIGFLLGRR